MRHLRFGVLVLLSLLIGLNHGNANHHDPDFKSLDSLALLLKGFDATEVNDHDRALELYARVIHAADLSAEHLSTAHRARGDSYFHQGFLELAIRDYGRALYLNPHNTAAYINRGNLRTRLGKYDLALEDFDNAINLDPHDALAFQNRGNIHFFSDNFSKAITDYRRSLGLEPSDLFSAIWLYLAKRRAGIDSRADLLAHSQGRNLEIWPGPVVSLYLDLISAAQLVQVANRHTGHEKDEMISEAHFYSGEFFLMNHQNELAVNHFRQTVARGPNWLTEFHAAKVVLKKLGH